MEQEIILDMFHEHPLSRIPNPATSETDYRWEIWCYGCIRFILDGEAVYGCSRRCGFPYLLHKECMEMPREIRHHPLHPSHPLTLDDGNGRSKCVVCEDSFSGLGYRCSDEGCDSLWIHMGCAGTVGLNDEKHPRLAHPSHPHELRISKKTRGDCDACGILSDHEKGSSSYICTVCDYYIHDSCALLPKSVRFPHHPDHSLSLAFYPPYQYIYYEFECAICRGPLRLRRWVYHCHICSYVVHINCATNTSPTQSNNEDVVDDGKDIIKGPIDDIYEEIIRPFIKGIIGKISIPQNITGKHKFPKHPHHLLSFITFSAPSSPLSSSHDHNEEDDGDDDESIPSRSELICDGCTLPIKNKQTYDEYDENGYMSCDECKYFLHLSCFNLPPHLPSLPLHPLKHHNLKLQNAGKLIHWEFCSICLNSTNGLFYACTNEDCSFNIDIKCASLPNTIKHAAHPRHNHLKLVTDKLLYNFCRVCYGIRTMENGFYRCESCKFCMCGGCVLLPAGNKHRLENHRLQLTYDAYVNHPGEFYCSNCEERMNPKIRMYHCRECDQSFHGDCIPATSGKYRNIKFGMQKSVSIHHHPLTFRIISKKKLCDVCRLYMYDKPGFQCASCNFVMCTFHIPTRVSG